MRKFSVILFSHKHPRINLNKSRILSYQAFLKVTIVAGMQPDASYNLGSMKFIFPSSIIKYDKISINFHIDVTILT